MAGHGTEYEATVDELADEAVETDNGSILTIRSLRERIGHRLAQHPHRDRLNGRYDSGEITHRQFLKLLGFVAIGTMTAGAGCTAYFGDPDGSVPAPLDDEEVFDVGSDGGVEPGSDISSVVNEIDSGTILVPGEEFLAEDTLRVGDDTTLFFDGATVRPPDGTNPVLFECDGTGWHVGGDLEVDQRASYPRVFLTGSGRFGDEHGRISFRGTTPTELIDDKNDDQHETGFLRMWGDPDDEIRFMNVDQYEAPPQNECADPNFFWTTYPGTLTVVRCHIGNFHDNGFYVKTMKGRLEIYDSYLINNNVAAVRNGVTGGVHMERCHVRTAGNRNPARTAGRTCAGINHSMMAFQDTGGAGDGQTGDVTLDTVCYSKGENPPAGEFLRRGPGEGGDCTVTIRNCTWPEYPDYGSGATVVDVVDDGGNSDGPCDAERGPAPFG